MNNARRAIVIGAGHNGLVAAAMLARRGLSPLVLEARSHTGGMLGDEAFRIAPMPFALRPEILLALGIRIQAEPMTTLVPVTSGAPVRISGRRVEGVPATAAKSYARLVDRLQRQSAALSGMILKQPPRFAGMSFREMLALGSTGLKLRRLGKDDLRDLMRIALSNVHDLIEDEVGDGPLGAALAMDATLGGAMGPRSPGTVLALLYRMASAGASRMIPAGGPGALVDVLENAVMSAGGKIRTNAPVEQILVDQDQVTGVRLAGGETVEASMILSSAAPQTTLLRFLGPEHLDAEFVRRCRGMAATGMVARLDFRLDDDPRLADGSVPGPTDRLVISESSQAIETAFNGAKYGGLPQRPVMEAHYDRTARRLSVSAQFVPCAVEGGWNEARRMELEKIVIRALGEVMPKFEKLVRETILMTPQDIEDTYAVAGGHWHHGELRIDQLLMLRPFDGAAHYRMPVEGLFLCGAGTHPGGDISGAPGFNCANAALLSGAR